MRAGDSVRDLFPGARSLDVGGAGQVVSTITGIALAVYGASRRTPAGVGLAALGAALVYQGLKGHHPAVHQRHDRSSRDGRKRTRGTAFEASILVERPPDELYRFWRTLDNLPKFMHHLDLVTPMSRKRSHWAVTTPQGVTVTWEGEMRADDEGRWVAWHATGTTNDYAGRAHFVPHAQGTEVRLRVAMDPNGGVVGRTFATLFGSDPCAVLAADLRRFKQLMEASDAAERRVSA